MKGYIIIICRNAESVHGQRKVGNPWSGIKFWGAWATTVPFSEQSKRNISWKLIYSSNTAELWRSKICTKNLVLKSHDQKTQEENIISYIIFRKLDNVLITSLLVVNLTTQNLITLFVFRGKYESTCFSSSIIRAAQKHFFRSQVKFLCLIVFLQPYLFFAFHVIQKIITATFCDLLRPRKSRIV